VTDFAAVRAAADRTAPRAAVVLGSGLSGATVGFETAAVVGYADVPGLVPPTVAGHRGQLSVGSWAGVPVLVFAGRVHFYEGHPWERVTRIVQLAAELGAKVLVLTNAAGGIHPALAPGSVMVIRDHVKLLDREAWRELGASPNPPAPFPEREGEERPSFSPPRSGEGPGEGLKTVYSPRLVAILQQLDPTLLAGTYAAVTGPSYETPAEIRALATLGADAVGMSTAMEAEAGFALGLEVCALSSVTNRAAGLSAGTLTHAEVEETAKRNAGRVGKLVGRLLANL
jgi:purine-nucleoside phosphorylase